MELCQANAGITLISLMTCPDTYPLPASFLISISNSFLAWFHQLPVKESRNLYKNGVKL
jgi:hypothetical protein